MSLSVPSSTSERRDDRQVTEEWGRDYSIASKGERYETAIYFIPSPNLYAVEGNSRLSIPFLSLTLTSNPDRGQGLVRGRGKACLFSLSTCNPNSSLKDTQELGEGEKPTSWWSERMEEWAGSCPFLFPFSCLCLHLGLWLGLSEGKERKETDHIPSLHLFSLFFIICHFFFDQVLVNKGKGD